MLRRVAFCFFLSLEGKGMTQEREGMIRIVSYVKILEHHVVSRYSS